MQFARLLFLAAAVSEGLARLTLEVGTGSPVEKVVTLLKDLKSNIERDGAEEEKTYNKYACWAAKITEAKAAAIDEARATLRMTGQEILGLKGKITSLTSDIDGMTRQIAGQKKEQSDATELRQQQNAAFTAEASETKQAIAALGKATAVLMKGTAEPALLQTESADSGLRAVVGNLLQVIPYGSKRSVLPQQVAFLEEFASSGTRYAPQSDTLQGILKNMYETFASDLQESLVTEARANTNFETLMGIKKKMIADLEETLQLNKDHKAKAESRLAELTTAYDETERVMKADTEFFDATKAASSTKSEEWKERTQLREQELQGIREALKILTADDARNLFGSVGFESAGAREQDPATSPSFLQISSSEAEAARNHAFVALRNLAKESQNVRLALLALRVEESDAGHFQKVIATIDRMIRDLKAEDVADVEKKKQCKEENQKVRVTVAGLKWKIKNNRAKINKLSLSTKSLKAEKDKTKDDIAQVENQISEMDQQRTEENQAFTHAKQNNLEAIRLLKLALKTFAKYYKENDIDMGPIEGSSQGLTFSQQQDPEFDVSEEQAPDATFSGKGARKGESKGIVSLMTMLIQDLSKEVKESDTSEEAAQKQYEKEKALATKMKDELTERKMSLKEGIATRMEEKAAERGLRKANQNDLDAAREYRAKIKPDCSFILKKFKERARKREAELSGLAGAKSVLAGRVPHDAALVQTTASHSRFLSPAAA